MTAMTALEQAVSAYAHRLEDFKGSDSGEQQHAMDSAVELGEYGIFSCRHIEDITGVPERMVAELINKRDKTGGRFSAQTLPLIHDLWLEYVQSGKPNRAAIRTIVGLGVSPAFLSKLTDIPERSVARWAKNGDSA